LGMVWFRFSISFSQAIQNGDSERRRFSRSGLGTSHHILPLHCGGDCLGLNGCGCFVLLIGQCTLQWSDQVEFLKSLQWSSLLGGFENAFSKTPASTSTEQFQ